MDGSSTQYSSRIGLPEAPDLAWTVATVAGVGHDMRSPLATLSSAIDLLFEDSELESHELAGMIRRQLSHLERMADDLMDFGRLICGVSRTVPQRFNVSELLQQVVDEFALVEAVSPNLSLQSASLYVYTDPYAVRRILQNLIGNAIKFSSYGQVVSVRATNLEAQGVLVQIEDEAGSLRADELERLFLPFERNDSNTDGQGLGLFVVSTLAQAAAVKFWLEATERGSCFNLILPIGQALGDCH